MARHRVGDSYLSDAEYAENKSMNWQIGLFLFVALFSGFVVHSWTEQVEFKFLRFCLVICPSVLLGYLAARYNKYIRMLITFLVCFGVLSFIGLIIWENM